LSQNRSFLDAALLTCLSVVEPDGSAVEIVGHRLPRGRSTAMAHVGFAAGYLPLPERLRVGSSARSAWARSACRSLDMGASHPR
jgi:hypothetical protein